MRHTLRNVLGSAAAAALALTVAPPAAAAAPATDPGCEVVEISTPAPEGDPGNGPHEWWFIGFRTSEGLEDFAFHFPGYQPGEVRSYSWAYPDAEASEAAGYHVYSTHLGGRFFHDADKDMLYFFVALPDGDPTPVVTCVPA